MFKFFYFLIKRGKLKEIFLIEKVVDVKFWWEVILGRRVFSKRYGGIVVVVV